MEGGSNNTSCMIAFGHNSTNGLCPMTMIPLSSSHPHRHDQHQYHHPNSDSNPLFLPLPPSTNSQDQNHNSIRDSSIILDDQTNTGCYLMERNDVNSSSLKAKIMAHPHYNRLLAAYVNCQKVGAPPEVVARLEQLFASATTMGPSTTGCIGEDPALDQFMEAYCEMLTKYEQELSKPFNEAMLFIGRIESQFKSITLTVSPPNSGDVTNSFAVDINGSSEEEADMNNIIDPLAEDRELKGHLLRKYSGYLGSLKQEFSKKRKKGKLPKEARQQLLDWWTIHYKWPYPSESQKLALAESTGLDQKQINNWFINQRKRHWKPSEDMQFVVMDAAAAPPHYFMDNVLGNPFSMDLSHALL